MKYIASIILLFFTTIAISQTLTGTVKTLSGEPIPYANIALLNAAKGTVADKEGNFTLELPKGNVQLAISAVGFASKIVSIYEKTDNLNIVLSENTKTLGALVVSANKREENILRVATSISSLSAQKVEDTRTVGLGNLTALVPNYLYQELGSGFQQIQAIRGIQVFSENPAVATYIDDVNNLDILANGMMLTDIERIEVLRGPQGTLFGRNAMGGVVNIITKKPTNKTEGFLEAGIGNLSMQRYAAGFKMPIIKDKLFFGVNALYQTRVGYWINDTTGTGSRDASIMGKTVGGEQNIYGNAYLKWLPSTRFSVTLNVKSQRDKSDETGFMVSQTSAARVKADPTKINLARIGEHDRDIVNTALTLKYFGDNYTITSITTSQRIGLSYKDVDFPGFYHSFYQKAIGEKLPPQNVGSQELRINGNVLNKKLLYTAGIFYFNQVGYEPTTNLAYETAANSYIIYRNKSDNNGTALFGELTYKITPKLSVTGGLRFDAEKRTSIFNGFGDAVFVGGQFSQLVSDTTVSGKYSAVSPKIAVAFAPNALSNIYVSYTRGFRAGGINAQRFPATATLKQTFDPEYSDNYEVGYKMQTKDNRLSVSASAFYIQWTNLQFYNLVAPFTYGRENVGDAQSMGFELEAAAIPVKGLQLDGSLGLAFAEYDHFHLERVNFFTGEITTTHIEHNKLSNTPSHTLFLGAQYTLGLTKKLNLVLRGEVRSIGSFYTDIQNTIKQDPYTLLNSNIGLSYGKYSLAFWGQNLNNASYLAFGTPDTSFGYSVRTSAPRTWGLTLKAKF